MRSRMASLNEEVALIKQYIVSVYYSFFHSVHFYKHNHINDNIAGRDSHYELSALVGRYLMAFFV